MTTHSKLYDKVYACLCGGLIGDAMGAPAEGRHYTYIAEHFGEISNFTGIGTDDTAIKHILVNAILTAKSQGGHITADEFAESFLTYGRPHYGKFWFPVLNMFHKVETNRTVPVYAGVGNMPSSSSAMAIAPLGIVNACDPLRAAQETFDVAGLIHAGESGFCRDAACAVAAGVAEAFRPSATPESCIEAATRYLHPVSSSEFTDTFHSILQLAYSEGTYQGFRARFYEQHLQVLIPDPRETVPAAFAMVYFSQGDLATGIKLAANFGRDADTIACMVGGLLGALCGTDGIPAPWLTQVEQCAEIDYRGMAAGLVEVIEFRQAERRRQLQEIAALSDLG